MCLQVVGIKMRDSQSSVERDPSSNGALKTRQLLAATLTGKRKMIKNKLNSATPEPGGPVVCEMLPKKRAAEISKIPKKLTLLGSRRTGEKIQESSPAPETAIIKSAIKKVPRLSLSSSRSPKPRRVSGTQQQTAARHASTHTFTHESMFRSSTAADGRSIQTSNHLGFGQSRTNLETSDPSPFVRFGFGRRSTKTKCRQGRFKITQDNGADKNRAKSKDTEHEHGHTHDENVPSSEAENQTHTQQPVEIDAPRQVTIPSASRSSIIQLGSDARN